MTKEAHQPTEKLRKMVINASGVGLPLKHICALVGIKDIDTLKLHYELELSQGVALVNLKVANNLFNRTEKDSTAAIYWTKARMGWRERAPIEDKKSMKGLKISVIEKASDDYSTSSD